MLSKMHGKMRKLKCLWSHFRASERGMIIIWVAILLPVLFGFTALAVDAAYLYAAKSRAQAAADAAALSAVYIIESASADAVRTRGAAAAQDNVDGTGPISIGTVTIERGVWNSGVAYPASGFSSVSDVTDASAAKAYVSLTDPDGGGLNLFFAKAIGFADQDVAAYAVANLFGGGAPENCILATDPNDDEAFEANGDVDMNFYDCNVKVNSDGSEGPGNNPNKIGADLSNSDLSFYSEDEVLYGFESVGTVNIGPQGGLYGFSGDETSASELQPRQTEQITADPYSSYNPLGQSSGSNFTCTSGLDADSSPYAGGPFSPEGATHSLSPAVYCGGLNLGGNGVIDLAPGLYVIQDGDFDVGGSVDITCTGCTGGAGVTFVLHNPTTSGANSDDYRFRLHGTGVYTFTAPDANHLPSTSGNSIVNFSQGGFVFWDEPDRTGCDTREEFETTQCDDSQHVFEGNTELNITGAIYAPFSDITVNGNVNSDSTGGGCFIMIGNTFTFNGGGGEQMVFSASGCEAAFTGTPLVTEDIFALVE